MGASQPAPGPTAPSGAGGIRILAQRRASELETGPRESAWPQSPTARSSRVRVVAPLALASLLIATSAGVAYTTRARAAASLHISANVTRGPWAAEFVDGAGRAARWNPCTPIHYVVNPAGAPEGALDDLSAALHTVSAASGLHFVYDGTTRERPGSARRAYQPDSYGDRWAPLLIAWAWPAQTSLLDDAGAQAVTVPVAVPGEHGGSIVSGQIIINLAHPVPAGFGPGVSEGEVYLHELGHAVGLAHTRDVREAMYPDARGVAAYGPGDRAGLRALGAPAGCRVAPRAHDLQVSVAPRG